MSAARSTPSRSISRKSAFGSASAFCTSSRSRRPERMRARAPGCSCSQGWTWIWQSKTRMSTAYVSLLWYPDGKRMPHIRAWFLGGACALATAVATAAPNPPTPVPTRIPTPVPPERAPAVNKGAAPDKRDPRYPNPYVSFSKITRVEEVDLDNDGIAEALVEGIGTFRNVPQDITLLGFVSRTRLPFENPIFAVFKRFKGGNDWDLLLAGHLPLRCRQTDDPAKCDELFAFYSIPFRFDDRRQVTVQIVHAGEPRVSETRIYRLDAGRLTETFGIALPKSAVDVSFGPDGVTRRIAVDTFINKDLPPRYRSFTLDTNYVFGERKFRILSESLEPEWGGGDVDLSYW